MQNIELKARLDSIDDARKTVARLATSTMSAQHQVDTYFRCHKGRLKLREINGIRAELIGYDRQDVKQAKASNYQIVSVPDPLQLKRVLSEAMGVLVVVNKQREISLYDTVRIHLDRVVGLGEFIEFEAVLASQQAAEEGHRLVAKLQDEFELTSADLCANSYSDMLLAE